MVFIGDNVRMGFMIVAKSFVGVWGNVADTAGVSSSESDESALSPAGSPGVLDSPVLISDTDQEDTVVEGGLAVVEHTGLVGWPVGGINGNWDGSAGKGGGQIVAVLDVSEAWDLEGTRRLGAGLLDGLVGVLILMDNSVVLDELEGIIHKTSIAGLVSVWAGAINELLLREALKSSVGELAETLKGSSGGESPAWSAWSLVLDWGDGTLGGPINITNLSIIKALNVVAGLSNDGSEVLLGEFFSGHGGELVKSHLIGSELVGVVRVDLGKVLKENSLPVGILKLRCILDAVLGLPWLELRDSGGVLHVQEDSCSTNDSKENSELLSVHTNLLWKSFLPIPIYSVK